MQLSAAPQRKTSALRAGCSALSRAPALACLRDWGVHERGRAWYARTRSSSRWLSWMVWLETAAADSGEIWLPPCSNEWYASATASGATPCSAPRRTRARGLSQISSPCRTHAGLAKPSAVVVQLDAEAPVAAGPPSAASHAPQQRKRSKGNGQSVVRSLPEQEHCVQAIRHGSIRLPSDKCKLSAKYGARAPRFAAQQESRQAKLCLSHGECGHAYLRQGAVSNSSSSGGAYKGCILTDAIMLIAVSDIAGPIAYQRGGTSNSCAQGLRPVSQAV